MSRLRLSEQSLSALSPRVARAAYDRAEQNIGQVHFGLGAFHRAHQATYTDSAMSAGDQNWAIAGVSLRSLTSRSQLAAQDGLYTVTERDPAGEAVTLISSVSAVLTAPDDNGKIIEILARPATRIVSFTITEKGYSKADSGGLDLGNAEISADLRGDAAPRTIYGFLHQGLARRRHEGHGGLSLISCDNLASNGAVLRSLFLEYLDRGEPSLAPWVEKECAFPSTMVDRIVPATGPDDLDAVERAIGVRDEGAVVTEAFSQWVIEDRFAGSRPRWEHVGVNMVEDVQIYEKAKLRILNAAHSALAYLGLRRRHVHIHEAIADERLRKIVLQIMAVEAARTLPADFPVERYVSDLLTRFGNAALPHRLTQIAMDGSQKIPQRWLATLAENQKAGLSSPALLCAVAAWLIHVRGNQEKVADPLAEEMAALWRACGSENIVHAVFGPGGLLRGWNPTIEERSFLRHRLELSSGEEDAGAGSSTQ